jgi:hypothetical protein
MSRRKSKTKRLNLKPTHDWLNRPPPLAELLQRLSAAEKAELALYVDDPQLEPKKD